MSKTILHMSPEEAYMNVGNISWEIVQDALEHERLHSIKNCEIHKCRRWWRKDGWKLRHYIELTHIACEEIDTTPLTCEVIWDPDAVRELLDWMKENLKSSYRVVLPLDEMGKRPPRVQLSNTDDAAFFKLTWHNQTPSKTPQQVFEEYVERLKGHSS